MSKLILVGDSNLYRNIDAARLSKKLNRPSLILHATRQQTLEVGINSVTSDCEVLVVSALANLLCDEYGQQSPDNQQLISSVTKYVDQVSKAPSVSTLLVPPFYRHEPKWFGEFVPRLRLLLVESAANYKHVTVLPTFKVCALDLLKDGVHLGSDSGKRFFDYVASCILDIPSPDAQTDPPAAAPETISDVMKLIRNEVLPALKDGTVANTKVNLILIFISIVIHVQILYATIHPAAGSQLLSSFTVN